MGQRVIKRKGNNNYAILQDGVSPIFVDKLDVFLTVKDKVVSYKNVWCLTGGGK